MPHLPAECGLDSTCARSADTVIFVDVDGVLNVGARDAENAPLVLDDAGARGALTLWSKGKHHEHPERDSIERIVSLSRRKLGHGEGSTYMKLAVREPLPVSDVLVGRLASLIQAAGNQRMVVLSSLWQRPQHRERVERLERAISEHLGYSFAFDARTGPRDECTPWGRLRTLGDFLQGLCTWRAELGGDDRLRILVLEDFHISALDGWPCDGTPMESPAAAERYLRSRAPDSVDLSVKLIHTYDEWRTPGGMLMQVGAGLTLQHFCQAARFLGGSCDFCAQPSPGASSSASAHTPRCGQRSAASGKASRRREEAPEGPDGPAVDGRPGKAARVAADCGRPFAAAAPKPLPAASAAGGAALASESWHLAGQEVSVFCMAR